MQDYDLSIHSNPDATAWAKFYVQSREAFEASGREGRFDDLDNMVGWFANAMMAMHDHVTGQTVTVLPDDSGTDLEKRLRAATMGFDWMDLPDDAAIPAVPLLREAADEIARLRKVESLVARMREALEPFAAAVYSDNRDMTVDRSVVDHYDFVRAYLAVRRAS